MEKKIDLESAVRDFSYSSVITRLILLLLLLLLL